MGLPDFIKKWFRPAPLPVIAVGTDIASYQLLEYLNNSPKFAPLYVLNEEPWHHRTYMFGAQLRYASELLALVDSTKSKKSIVSRRKTSPGSSVSTLKRYR